MVFLSGMRYDIIAAGILAAREPVVADRKGPRPGRGSVYKRKEVSYMEITKPVTPPIEIINPGNGLPGASPCSSVFAGSNPGREDDGVGGVCDKNYCAGCIHIGFLY